MGWTILSGEQAWHAARMGWDVLAGFPDQIGPSPVALALHRARPEREVCPACPCGEERPEQERRDSFPYCDPDNVPIDFASYLHRQNRRDAVELTFAARCLSEAGVRGQETCGDVGGGISGTEGGTGPFRERKVGGWPRLGDVPARVVEDVHRRVQVMYRIQTLVPAGSRVDVVG